MKGNWVKVYSASDEIQVKLAEGLLKQNGIESHIVSHTSSVFPGVSDAELHTPPDKSEAAIRVLTQKKLI